jgi:hypothetical protein
MKTNKLREINKIEDKEVGKLRKELYAHAYKQIAHAKSNECWLEIIALCDSIIGDRIESLVARLGNQSLEGRAMLPVKQACTRYGNTLIKRGFPSSILSSVVEWADSRNRHIHEMVKVREAERLSWKKRVRLVKKDAIKGVSLTRKVDLACKKTLKLILKASAE